MRLDATATPRISEAKTLLPLLRAKLAAAARGHTLPAGMSLGLLPLVEDGLFGYEIVPDRQTQTYLTIGWNGRSEAVLRMTLCSTDRPSALRLAAVNGKRVGGAFAAPTYGQQRDLTFGDISDAAEAGFSHLAKLFPEAPRRPIELPETLHRYLDAALSTAHEYLLDWDPYIQFFGLPNEEQFGFALSGDFGESGELVAQRPDMWVLRWKWDGGALAEEWAVALPDRAAGSAPRLNGSC